ncbi:MAG: MFS transporter [Candidatus Rokubacteria bacterium]|nr:MFS transporter [Candidatus Rokubacteria bacterium]
MTRLRRPKTPSYRWVIVSTLSVTETISWGILYYAFGILLAPMEREMGWSRAQSTAAFSIALLVSAIFAVPVGRWVDRGGARFMMTLGSCAGAALMVAWARVESLPALYLIWAAVGVTMAAVLYEPAFAVLAKWFVHDRERGFTILTLAAGLASTIFNPIASLLAASLGWRQAVLVLAAILGATTIPMHAILLRGGPADEGKPAREATARREAVGPSDVNARAALRTATFWFLALAFLIQSFAHAGISLHSVPMLIEWGYKPTFAATVIGLVGAMQVLGRLVFAPLRTRLSARAVTMLILACQSVAFLILWGVPGVVGLFAFVAFFGISNGMATLVRASLVAELWGRTHYGAIAGALSVWSTLARAAAPLSIGLAYLAWGGYGPILLTLAILSALAVLSAGRALSVAPSALSPSKPA